MLLLYKLSMTVLILFVSDNDENKILFGMLGATAMMATLAFFQPFKHPKILSINTGAQMVVLLVLFAAMFLLVNRGDSIIVAAVLVLSTLAPLVAGVAMTLRLPKDAHVSEAGDTITGDLSSLWDSVKDWCRRRRSQMQQKRNEGVELAPQMRVHTSNLSEVEHRRIHECDNEIHAMAEATEIGQQNPMHTSRTHFPRPHRQPAPVAAEKNPSPRSGADEQPNVGGAVGNHKKAPGAKEEEEMEPEPANSPSASSPGRVLRRIPSMGGTGDDMDALGDAGGSSGESGRCPEETTLTLTSDDDDET